MKCPEGFVTIKEEIQGVLGNSSLSLDPPRCPSCRFKSNQLFSLRKHLSWKDPGPDWQGAGLEWCREGSALKGKLRYWGSLPPGGQPLPSPPPSSQTLTCASWSGLATRLTLTLPVAMEPPGPIACKSDPRISMQWQHSDWVTLRPSLRVRAVWPQRAAEQHPAMKGVPCRSTAAAGGPGLQQQGGMRAPILASSVSIQRPEPSAALLRPQFPVC